VNQTRSISADTALRLGRYFSTTPQFWMNLQSRYDLDVAADLFQKEIESFIQPRDTKAA
jgi:plasmid maintenance system antidote protein VapI